MAVSKRAIMVAKAGPTAADEPEIKFDMSAISAQPAAEFNEFVRFFEDSHDRVAVIVGSAVVEEYLTRIIEKRLLPGPPKRDSDPLFRFDGPAGTFSAKTELAYRLNLVDKEFKTGLDMVRKVRNAFAHQIATCDMSKSPLKDHTKVLLEPLLKDEAGLTSRKTYPRGEGVANDFRWALGIMAVQLGWAVILPINLPLGRIPVRWPDRTKPASAKAPRATKAGAKKASATKADAKKASAKKASATKAGAKKAGAKKAGAKKAGAKKAGAKKAGAKKAGRAPTRRSRSQPKSKARFDAPHPN